MSNSRSAMFALTWFAGWIEVAFSALLLIGFWGRFAAFILSGELAFVYFIAHAPRSFYPIANGGEIAVLYCFVFLYLAAAGPGPISADAMRGRA
jgi:putative oxidoreductase